MRHAMTLSERKDAASGLLIRTFVAVDLVTDVHTRAARKTIYGRTSPRPGLCDFDAFGMDIIEGRA